MTENQARAIAIVGVGAVLPDAPDAPTYWENLTKGRYSISEVDADRWDRDLYYDADPAAPDKTYSIIGGWVRDSNFEPLKWRMPIPPKVSEAMDRTQKWSVSASRQTLMDYGYPDRPLDPDRTAVIFGNAMAGDMHYLTALRAYFPEYAEELKTSPSFAGLPEDVRAAIIDEFRTGMRRRLPDITEDTMPGELSNIIAGRVANLFNFHGPNFVTDAACASALAAIDAAVEGLQHGDYDSVLTGGIDANMGVPSFIKFCKIGALSATGTRPYHQGADGFVMGEGAAVMLLKRLADAERDGDHIYAVIRGLGGSSDGKGKGITAPNPIGQEFAVARAWRDAGIAPTRATYIEGHGTSTRVGDVVEVESLSRVFADLGLAPGSMPLGSVKSNIGHLKSAAGAAGMLKAAMALDTKILPPTLGTSEPNPNIDFARSPLYLNKELAEWKTEPGHVRSAGVSAFGFGGTNFHIVLEEYIPGRIQVDGGKRAYSFVSPEPAVAVSGDTLKAPLRGALVVGAATGAEVKKRLSEVLAAAEQGEAPDPAPPRDDDLRAEYRVAIDYGDAAELAEKVQKAIRAIDGDNAGMWKALRNQGVFVGKGAPKMTAFLYTGQGSQYVNMLETLRSVEPIVADVFDEADRVMEPVLGRALTDFIFVDGSDKEAAARAERGLMQTEITQPAVLTVDDALTQLTAAYGIYPDMVMGHSLGEYGALVAAGAMPFEDALEAVAGRGKEMASVDVPDKGLMAAVFAPIEEVQRIADEAENYVVVANVNSSRQAVIGGSTAGVTEAGTKLAEAGHDVIPLPVSHAFHTEIVAPASESLKNLLTRLRIESPAIPLVANVDGEFYPMGPNVAPKIIDILGRQVAAPVQFVKGLRKLYDSGCRVFVEMGPKRALQGFADDVLGDDPEVVALFANHPKQGDIVSFNQALCGMYAAGLGVGTREGSVAPGRTAAPHVSQTSIESRPPAVTPPAAQAAVPPAAAPFSPAPSAASPQSEDMYNQLGHIFADFLAKGYEVYSGQQVVTPAQASAASRAGGPTPLFSEEPVVVTGAGLGLPGGRRVFGDDKVPALLHGEQFIDAIPLKHRQQITDKKITRLVKSEAGGGRFETIDNVADVIKLAGRGGEVDLVEEFGFPKERVDALDRSTLLAIGAGLDALRDAGIPLAMHYKTTTTGTKLPERWMLPEAYRDTTGVIFASAFPGADAQFAEVRAYEQARALEKRLEEYKSLQSRLDELGGSQQLAEELQHRIHEIEAELERNPYLFNRKFLYRALSMGHSQFAEYIGARGPNTQVNSACASTTQAVAIAEDWIRAGRCERVIVVAGDDVTSDNLLEWVGAGFLAVGAAATDEAVEDAALPFDRRRHGMILGMGAAAIVVEHPDSVRQRGIAPIAQVLAGNSANSAFHGSRLDPSHIKHVVEDVVAQAERRWGINRHEIAPSTVFVSHETYTPARGGSAQAEIDALRFVFGESADKIVIANTKGYTGHAMGVGVEDVLAIKAMETGLVPPVPNFKEPDPDLGVLNLSRGGSYPIQYALRLGAGFGSQIATTLYRHVPQASGVHPEPDQLGYESRLADPARWKQWLQAATGNPNATVEIERRTLRVRDDGAPVMAPQLAPAVQSRGPSPSSQVSSPAPVAPAASIAPAAPVVPVAPVAPAAAVSEPVGDPVADRVLEIVSAQTGYPSDMLDLDLDMEADLGIDTVKQAETFAAIREEWGIARDDSLALRDYPTLGAVIGFVYEKTGMDVPGLKSQVSSPESVAPAAATPVEAVAAVSEPVGDAVQVRVLEIVSAQTGYPSDMLDLDLDMEADLGIDTVKQAETFAAIREEWGIARDDSLALRDYPTLGAVIGFVYEKTGMDVPGLKSQVSSPESVAPAAATPVEAVAVVEDPVRVRVLEIVSAQTGYPSDMLDLDLDMEADLGIDTVKQAETFAAIREEWGIARDDSLALRDYPTLGAVIGFVYEKTGMDVPGLKSQVSSPESVAPAAATPVEAVAVVEDPVRVRVLEIVSAQTGYPSDMLDLDLDMEADLGIDTVKQAETFAAIREEWGIARDDSLALRDYPTLGAVIGFVYDRAEGLERPRPADLGRPVAVAATTPPPVAPETSTVTAAAPPAAPEDPVRDKVLEIVSAQTGYPSDMLDLDLDMEADLGIDTVKQAETFAAIREEWGIARDDSLALRDYPTLGAVIGFVYEKTGMDVPGPKSQVSGSGSGVVSSESVAPAAPGAVGGGAFEVMRGDYDAAAAVPRRIPTAVLRPDLALCKPTGIELGEGSRVVVMLDEGGVGASLVKKLDKRGVATLVIDDRPASDELLARLDRFSEGGPISGVYWLRALDVEAAVADMDLAAWKEALRVRVKLLYAAMRHLYDTVGADGTFLVSATRLGGRHGYDAAGAVAPLGGAVTGFTKAFKREKPEALVKAVDFPVSRKTAALADALIEETLTDPGAVEIGRADDRRWSVALVEEALAEDPHGIDLGPESVYVVTGAAGSITSAITADLARAGGGVFHLLDLTPEPDRADPDIVAFGADKEGLKRSVFERLKASGERATPAMVDKQLAGIERLHAALTAIRAIEDAGGSVHYHCVNLLDGDAVEAAMARVAEISGRVDVLLHAGGLEISRLLPDKEPGEYDLVFDVKADGWFNLLHGLGDTPIASTVVFSSVAGRFGNNGQTDYSAANDLLCKFTSSFKTTHPERLGVAFDWTAWGDIGMATRGSIPTVMKALGVDMLPAAAGIPIVRRELTLRQETGEQVVALRLGGMAGETDDSGGFTGTTRKAAVLTEASSFELYRGLVATATLDPTVQPFLFDHKIDGTALLPGVMGMETFAELAMLAYPDMHAVAVEDMQFLAPFKFYRDEAREIKVSAVFTMDGDDILAHCKLVGERVLANQPEPQVTEHFTGTVRLGAEPPTLEPTKVPEQSEATVGAADIYEIYFHGPAYQVLESAWADGERVAGLMASGLAPNHIPEDAPTATWPRGAELAFQTSGVWEIGTTAKMALPMQVGRVQFAGDASAAQGRLVAVVQPTDAGFSVRIADEAGTTYLDMTGYATSALPGLLPDDQVAPLRQAITGG